MKFLCDRCKTRYSIGDDRVRGKILKIRCKNCANVITVREGMPEPDAAAEGPRRTKTTTAAPLAEASSANGGAKPNALSSAFASAMSKPPPALEEEWYVSIDGDQSGPFSLTEAQRWVGDKPYDAELHCWSEGFDDWLPVDKVSHFRGLRRKPNTPPPAPSAAPPPLPRIGGTGPARAIAPRIPEEEHTPKPLFAATMASLEKAAAPAAMAASAGSAGSVASTGAAAVGALRVEARAPVPSPKPHVNGGNGSHLPAASKAPSGRIRTSPGLVPNLPAKPMAFDASETATQAEAPPFPDGFDERAPAIPSVATKPMPHLKAVAPAGPNDAFLDALAKERAEAKAASAKPMLSLAALSNPDATDAPTLPASHEPAAPVPDARGLDDDDDMEIGEVSRVVNLADLARSAPKRAATSATHRTGAVGKITGPVGRVTGSVPKLNATAGVPLIDAVDAVPSGNLPAVVDAPAPEEKHSRRGLIVLLVGAAILLGTAAVILVLKLNTPEDVTGLGGAYEYDPTRPEITWRPGDPGPGPGSGSAEPPQNPFLPKQSRPQITTRPTIPTKPPDPPAGNSLKSDEIEAMARSTSTTTTACFRRASKGVDDIILSDVKKIRVSFKVNPDGTVAPNSVDLSEKRSATLMSCIQRMVAGWKFRPNAGGDFGFVFAKPD